MLKDTFPHGTGPSWAAASENVPSTGSPNENSNHSAHPRSLITVSVARKKKPYILGYPIYADWRFWSVCVIAQADLNLRWAHVRRGSFSDVMVVIFFSVLFFLQLFTTVTFLCIDSSFFFFFFFLIDQGRNKRGLGCSVGISPTYTDFNSKFHHQAGDSGAQSTSPHIHRL